MSIGPLNFKSGINCSIDLKSPLSSSVTTIIHPLVQSVINHFPSKYSGNSLNGSLKSCFLKTGPPTALLLPLPNKGNSSDFVCGYQIIAGTGFGSALIPELLGELLIGFIGSKGSPMVLVE